MKKSGLPFVKGDLVMIDPSRNLVGKVTQAGVLRSFGPFVGMQFVHVQILDDEKTVVKCYRHPDTRITCSDAQRIFALMEKDVSSLKRRIELLRQELNKNDIS